MRMIFVAAPALGAMLCSCEQSADQVGLSDDLERDFLALKQEYGLTDEQLAAHIREWVGTAVSIESLVDREDLWGPDGLSEGDIEEMVRKMGETVYEMEMMQMFGEVVVLEYLVNADVQGAEKHLRSNIAFRYKHQTDRNKSGRTARILDRVDELAQADPKLKELLDSAAQGDNAN